jgi:type VI secretion system protein ImpF
MAGEPVGRERLQPSLLDRLTDHAPEQRRESFEQQTLSGPQLRQAVLRDLAWLLNTVNLTATEDLTATPLAAVSALNFGLPGFTGLLRTSSKVNGLEAAITQAIRAYEPRIRPDTLRVRARALDGADATTPALVFDIEGEIWAQPAPQPVFLETSIEIESRLTVVTDAQRRR